MEEAPTQYNVNGRDAKDTYNWNLYLKSISLFRKLAIFESINLLVANDRMCAVCSVHSYFKFNFDLNC